MRYVMHFETDEILSDKQEDRIMDSVLGVLMDHGIGGLEFSRDDSE